MPLVSDKLPIFIVVPIALTHFASSEMLPIAGNLYVAKLSDDVQLARVPQSLVATGVNETVVGAATHALVLAQWEMPNQTRYRHGTDDINWYPTEIIDRFFDALRVVTAVDSGYGQVFILPVGWATSYRAHLRPLMQGALVRRYPSRFERWGWLAEEDPITELQVKEIGALYQHLVSTGDGALSLAARRVSTAVLRDTKRDAILDLIIGLEAVLGDRTTTEVTHKLALRAAAVLSRIEARGEDAGQVFKTVKHLYGYRSAVAHGNLKEMRKKETVKLGDGSEVDAVELAASYLRRVIHALAAHPELKSGKEIDEEVILAALARVDASMDSGTESSEPPAH